MRFFFKNMLVVKRLEQIWKGVKKGRRYTFKICKHFQATHICKIGSWQHYNKCLRVWWQKKCIKLIQFATLFHTLKHGKPILDYESHKTKNYQNFWILRKTWRYIGKTWWGEIWPNIAHNVVLEPTKFVFTTTQYRSLTYVEVTIIDNHIHVYVMQN